MGSFLELKGVSLSYAKTDVLSDVSFCLQEGEVLALLGASGCGKSTLLRAIAGLLPLRKGEILRFGAPIHHLPVQERNLGMIFQDYALFSHLTVWQNLLFAVPHLSRKKQSDLAEEMLARVRLEGLEKRYPHQLSGGQQQRVAIARALMREPSLLLLDEPFSNLDNVVREQLLRELADLFKACNISAIFVTHNKAEAFALADQVALIEGGRIVANGEAKYLYDKVDNEFLANFLGQSTALVCRRVEAKWHTIFGVLSEVEAQKLGLTKNEALVTIWLRPHQMELWADDEGSAEVLAVRFLGEMSQYKLLVAGEEVFVMSSRRFDVGARVRVVFCF